MRLCMFRVPFVCALVILMPACHRSDQQIKVYRVSKAPLEESAPQQQDAMPTNTAAPRMPGGLAPTAATEITTPPKWEPQPLSQMRQASFLCQRRQRRRRGHFICEPGAAAGNVLDNVNRWLDQLGQQPITRTKLAEIAQRLRTSLGDVTIVDLAGLRKTPIQQQTAESSLRMVTTGSSTSFQNAWQRRSY